MFNENSGLVKVWVSLIQKGLYSKEDIPAFVEIMQVVEKGVAEDGE